MARGTGTAIASAAAGGAASAVVGNLLSKIESLFKRDIFDDQHSGTKRDVSAIKDIIQAVPSLSADDKQTVKDALIAKISTLQTAEPAQDPPAARRDAVLEKLIDLQRRSLSASPKPAAPASSGIGSAVASSAVGGAVSATVGNLLNKIESLFKRSDLEDLIVRSEFYGVNELD